MGQGQRFWAEADNKNTLISFWIDCSPRVSCQWSENEKNPKGASWIPQNLESDSETILASLGSWAQLQNRRKPGNHFCRLLHIFMSNKIFYFLWYTHYINEYHFFPVVGRFFFLPQRALFNFSWTCTLHYQKLFPIVCGKDSAPHYRLFRQLLLFFPLSSPSSLTLIPIVLGQGQRQNQMNVKGRVLSFQF